MTSTSPNIYYICAAIVVILLLVALVVATRRAESKRLHRRFGAEYDREVRERGNRDRAERELASRERRVARFHLEDLPLGARRRYMEEWRAVQARFVDEPTAAVLQADTLITNVMRDRNYPITAFDERVADLSPDHANVLNDYRAAHEIAAKTGSGRSSTEDLRQAMVHYRALFVDLVGVDERTA